jgi:thiamine-monophosphate kinase
VSRTRERTVADAGEAHLIGEIRRAVERSGLGNVGALGDDAAILPRRRRGGGREVVSTDLLVEGTHWRSHHLSARQLGRRALVVNLSDLAAMGARPLWFTLGLGMPPTQPLAWFGGLLRALIRASEEFRCPLVGGDLVRAPVATISITVSGRSVSAHPCRRDTARVGETICVTGDLGRARLALELLEDSRERGSPPAAIIRRHRRPEPRLAEAEVLAASGAACSMIDLSDGLIADLGWICRLSGVGAVVELDALPIRPSARRLFRERGQDPATSAALSGEEFELLFTTRQDPGAIRRRLRRREIKTPVTAIGRTVREVGIRWRRDGVPVTLPEERLFAHFTQGGGPGRT